MHRAGITRLVWTWSIVPPVKSTLYLGPPCTTSQITVASAQAPENM